MRLYPHRWTRRLARAHRFSWIRGEPQKISEDHAMPAPIVRRGVPSLCLTACILQTRVLCLLQPTGGMEVANVRQARGLTFAVVYACSSSSWTTQAAAECGLCLLLSHVLALVAAGAGSSSIWQPQCACTLTHMVGVFPAAAAAAAVGLVSCHGHPCAGSDRESKRWALHDG